MLKGIFEYNLKWNDITLEKLINANGIYREYNLFLWNDNESYDLGITNSVYDEYKDNIVFLIDDNIKQIYIRGIADYMED